MKYPWLVGILVVLLIGGIGGGIWYNNSTPGQYDGFAQCLTDKGAKFYGAYWCPHCANQKKAFGKSAKKLPYVECAIPGSSGAMTSACTEAKIDGFPTWIFADGSRETGEQTLQDLAEKTGCTLTP